MYRGLYTYVNITVSSVLRLYSNKTNNIYKQKVFEEKTMNFVNSICDIVHSCVDKFNGYTNKNIPFMVYFLLKYKKVGDKAWKKKTYMKNTKKC